MIAASSTPDSPGRTRHDVLALAAGVVFVALGVRACDELWQTVAWAPAVGTIGAVLAAVVGARYLGARPAVRSSDRLFLSLTVLLFVGIRLPWVLVSPTLPVSDFAFYDLLARQIAAGGPVTVAWPAMGLVAAWGYPVALAGPYALFGPALVVARCCNLFLGVATLLALYAFAHRAGGGVVARVACVLFLLWPAQWFYASVPATEHLALPLLLLALSAVACALDAGQERLWLGRVIAAGVLLGASFVTRSVSGTAAGAALLVLLVEGRRTFGARLGRSLALAAAFTLTVVAYTAVLDAILAASPAGSGWWSVFVGANVAQQGKWNLADADAFTAQPDLATANRFAREAALARIAADPAGYAALFVGKVATLWEQGTDGVFWSTVSMNGGTVADQVAREMDTLVTSAQAFHAFTLMLGALGILCTVGRPRQPGAVVIGMVFLVVATLAHGIVETQSRYNFTLVPVLFVFAGIAVARLADSIAAARERSPRGPQSPRT